jgi:hypothetical protein
MPRLWGASSSPEELFASEVIALVRVILGLKARRLDGFALRIERPDGPPVTMNLDNIYAEARQVDGHARTERLRRAALAMVPEPGPADWRDAAPLLLPAVRAVSWANAVIGLSGAGASAAIPFGRPLVPFVKVLCAIDSPHSISFATAADLAAWGVSDDEALRTAAANLARMPCQVQRNGAMASIVGPDGYSSSWLAAPAALSRVAADIGGSVIAVAAERDQLLLIDTEHPEPAARMLELTLERGCACRQSDADAKARRLFLVLDSLGQAGHQRPAPPSGRARVPRQRRPPRPVLRRVG